MIRSWLAYLLLLLLDALAWISIDGYLYYLLLCAAYASSTQPASVYRRKPVPEAAAENE